MQVGDGAKDNGTLVSRERRHQQKRVRAVQTATPSPRKRVNTDPAPSSAIVPFGDQQVEFADEIRCESDTQRKSGELCSDRAQLATVELAEACLALKLKLKRDKNGRRQYDRRLRSQPFKLSASQKNLMATSYRTARHEGREVDYERMAASIHFKTLKGNAPALHALEKQLIRDMKEALDEQRLIEAGEHVRTPEEWEKQLANCQAVHKQERAVLQKNIQLLEDRRSAENATIACLRAQLASVRGENENLKRNIGFRKPSDDSSSALDMNRAELRALKECVDSQREVQEHIRADLKTVFPYLQAPQLTLETTGNALAWAKQLADLLHVELEKELQPVIEKHVHGALKKIHQMYHKEQLLWRKENREIIHEITQTINALRSQGGPNGKSSKNGIDHKESQERHHSAQLRDEAIQEALQMLRS